MKAADEPSRESAAPPLNEAQARAVLMTLRHIDELLAEIAAIARDEDENSALPRYRRELTAGQARATLAQVAALRRRLHATLRRLGIAPPAPDIPARRAIEVRLIAAHIALRETDAEHLRDYGALSPAAVPALQAAWDDLRRGLDELRTRLERC
jgi:glycerol-3-phosphate O-acyltransferase